MAVLQAEIDGIKMDKKMLYRHIPREDVAAKRERAVLEQIDWEACADPDFYENHRLFPRPVAGELPPGVAEEWVWYDTTRFSGTRITLAPGATYTSKGLGVHGLFAWKGTGFVDRFPVQGQQVALEGSHDEFLVAHAKALQGTVLSNTGDEPMVVFKFFGPDINNAVAPRIRRHAA
jgi:hypothetical protein